MKARVVALAAAALLSIPAGLGHDGGGQSFRIVTTGDAYLVAQGHWCAAASDAPTDDPDAALCWALDQLGYDGLTGATTSAVAGHVNVAYHCRVTGSATAPAGGRLVFPANMAISDSIVVGFDVDGDGTADVSYGGRLKRPPTSALLNRAQGAVTLAGERLLAGDASGAVDAVAGVLEGPQWWNSPFVLNGATPAVAGNVDGGTMFVWNQGGSDVTVGCTF